MIYFTSDLHFGHNRAFIYEVRGYQNIDEMNQDYVKKFNSKVQPEDEVYILGDVMLGNDKLTEEYLKQLNGKKYLILGNHDSSNRIKIYEKYFETIKWADCIKYKKKRIFLSHFPCLTGNLEANPHECVYNFYGHTHQTNNFYEDRPYMYHVGVDSHNGYPVSIDEIFDDIKNKIEECKQYL